MVAQTWDIQTSCHSMLTLQACRCRPINDNRPNERSKYCGRAAEWRHIHVIGSFFAEQEDAMKAEARTFLQITSVSNNFGLKGGYMKRASIVLMAMALLGALVPLSGQTPAVGS